MRQEQIRDFYNVRDDKNVNFFTDTACMHIHKILIMYCMHH